MPLSGHRVVGYRVINNRLVPHHEEREAGELASKLRTNGSSIREIIDEFSARNIARASNRPWSKQSVRRLISRARAGWPKNPCINGMR